MKKLLVLLGLVCGCCGLVEGMTLYKIGSDGKNYSSFVTNVSATVGWSTTQDASKTTAFSPDEFKAAECVIPSGLLMRTPPEATDCTFAPKLLRLQGTINIKNLNYGTVTFTNLISESGMIGNANDGYTYTLAGKITIADGMGFTLSTVDTGARVMYVTAGIAGAAGTELIVSSTATATGSGATTFFDLSEFSGALRNTATNSTIDLAGAFSGTIGALDKDPTLKVAYDGLPANTGLRVTATTIPDTLKSKLRFYSADRNFLVDGLPLLSFPAGTEVEPDEFAIGFATSADADMTIFPALKVVTGANNEVILAVDGTTPVTAKYLPAGDESFSWHFFGSDGSDVTATCGLTEPTAAITVLIENSAQFEALKTVTYTAQATRIATFEATADTDLTSAAFPYTIDANAFIDVKGFAVDFPSAFFSNSTATVVQLVQNGGFEEFSIKSGAIVSATPSGWSTSGNVWLSKNNGNYTYKQQNSSIWCTLGSGASITQTITMPADGRCAYSVNYSTKNNKNGVVGTSVGAVQIDGTNVVSWSNMGNKTTATATGSWALTAGTHTLTIKCTSGYGINIDNVSFATQAPSATVTDTVGGGAARVTVAEGATVANAGVQMKGKLKFVKDGAGTFVAARVGQTYAGGNEVVAGKLTLTDGTGTSTDFSGAREPFGARSNTILVRTGATFDIAGNYGFGVYHIILDGGTLRSGTLANGKVEQNQTNGDTSGGIGWLSLTTNATFYLRSSTVFCGWGNHPVDLGGNVLTIEAPIDNKYVYWSKAITNGTLRLNGVSTAREYFLVNTAVDAKTVDVIDNMGINFSQAMSVRGYNPICTWTNTLCTGTAALNVYGTFRPDSDIFYGCTLQDGATLDLSGKTATWSVKSASTVGRTVVTFADSARITLNLAGRDNLPTQLVDWKDNVPTNLATLTFVPDAETFNKGRHIYWDERGIFVSSGTCIFVR